MSNAKEQQRRVRDYRARKTVHEQRTRRIRRDNVLAVVAVIVVAVIGGLGQWWYTDSIATHVPSPDLAESRTWTGDITINHVDLGIELDGEAAPQGVSAFVYDAQRDYFTDKTCHRLTTGEGFSVLQCGSLTGDGSGDPDFAYGPIENAPTDDLYPAGTIAMARGGGDANSNGHQFFIVYADTTIPADEAGGYTVIGHVTSGLDQLTQEVIAAGIAPDSASPTDGAPAITVTIDGVTVE